MTTNVAMNVFFDINHLKSGNNCDLKYSKKFKLVVIYSAVGSSVSLRTKISPIKKSKQNVLRIKTKKMCKTFRSYFVINSQTVMTSK